MKTKTFVLGWRRGCHSDAGWDGLEATWALNGNKLDAIFQMKSYLLPNSTPTRQPLHTIPGTIVSSAGSSEPIVISLNIKKQTPTQPGSKSMLTTTQPISKS